MLRFFKITRNTCVKIRVHFRKKKSAMDFMIGIFNDTYVIFVPEFLYKNIYRGYSFDLPQQVYESICCWYSFELPQLVEAIQMSTHNIYYYKRVNDITCTAI